MMGYQLYFLGFRKWVPMQFHQKLTRLTEDRIKAVLCKRAGLPATAISNLLAKKQMPSADTAFRIARTLSVSLEWLLDDNADWPPVRIDSSNNHDRGPQPIAA